MKNLKRYTLKPLPIFALLGLILSLTQLAAPAKAQTTNRDEIRAKIQQLEREEKELNQDIASDKALIPRLDSDDYVILAPSSVGGTVAFAAPRSYIGRRLSVLVHLGKITPQEAINSMDVYDKGRKQFQGVLRQELPQLEQRLEKTHDESRTI